MHAATTTFSRYIADVDADCLYWFEPDHGQWALGGALGFTVDEYAAILQCEPDSGIWGGWSGFVDIQMGFQTDGLFQACSAQHGSPAEYVSTHCSQSWDLECVPRHVGCQSYCRSKPCVALKSIKLDGKVVPMLRAWEPLDNMALVTVYRDSRGVLSSLIRRNYMPAHGAIGNVEEWVNQDSSRQHAEQVLEWARGRAVKMCADLSADLKGVSEWYRAHAHPLYVRINSEDFMGQDHVAETRLADEVRALLGMVPLSEARLRLPGLPLASAATMRKMPAARVNDSSWDSVMALLGPRFESMVREVCADSLFAEQDWRIEAFGRRRGASDA